MEESFSPDSSTQPKKNFRWIAIIVVVLVVLGAAGLFSYKEIKSYRSNGVLAEAQVSLEEGDLKAAYEKGVLSIKLDSHNVEALRFMAILATRLQSTEAFTFWESLILSGEQTLEDKESYVAFCLRLRHLEKAAPVLQALLDQERPSEDAIGMGIQFWRLQRNPAQAEILVGRGLQLYPENPYFQLTLAELYIQSRERSRLRLARSLLWNLRDMDPLEVRLRALDLLSRSFILTPNEEKTLLNAETLKPTNTNEHLLVGDLKIRLNPFNREAIIEQVLQDLLSTDSVEHPKVGAWLVRYGQFEKALNLLPKEEALSDPEYTVVYLDALSGLGKWEELADVLFDVQSNLNLDPLVLQVFRTRVALALGDAKLAEAQWEHTLSLAKGNAQGLLYVGQYFDRTGGWFYAWQAYDELLKEPSLAMAIGRRMIQMAESQGETEKVAHVLERLSKTFPNELGPKNDLAYMNLLLGQNIEQSFNAAQELMQLRSDDMAVRSTMALAYLRQGKAQKAYKLYSDVQVDWNNALPYWKAVYAAVLDANGNTEEARRMVLRINYNQLKPEEMALLKDLI